MKSSGINDAMDSGVRRMLGLLRQLNLRVTSSRRNLDSDWNNRWKGNRCYSL